MKRYTGYRTGVLAAVILLAGICLAISQTPQTSSANRKAGSTAKKKSPSQRRLDSLATARADSIARAEAELARQDSIRRVAADIERRRLDSIQTYTLRTIDNKAFGPGERLVFDISFGVITAGEAIMTIARDSLEGRLCHRVEVQVNSLPSFSWIYKVEDRYLTYIDVEALVPWKFEQHIREGGYRRDFIADFDQYHHRATTTEGEYGIPAYVHDIMSAFFFVRTVDFRSARVGDMFVMHNFYKDTTYELGVKFLGRQTQSVEAGEFRTIVLEPLVREGGLFKSEGRIVVWLTDDERKMPVRVNTKIVIGSIDTELREYSGLVGPVTARLP